MISTFEFSLQKNATAAALLLVLILLLASTCLAQQLTGTLSATVTDAVGAVVPNAKVTMKNDRSGDVRTTVSNGSGYFTITAVQPGSYSVIIEAPGFKTWQQPGIVFNQGDSRTLPSIKLEVGQVSETVEIKAGADVVIPDNSEVSTTLNTELIEDVPIVGRDAGELLKVMPGMALTNGLGQGSGFNDKVVGTNNGPVGAYSSNGTQPYGAMAFMLDGANLVDPGNAGTQIANINQDMVSEVKVLMSSYSAEYAKGPVIFQAFSKSGGNAFHGEGYLYARNSALNSVDAYSASQGLKNPPEHFYYMGGNIGGPILLPFTDFNKSRKKLFFWAGYEYMNQHPAATPINYNVPTEEQKAGDFSNTTINGLNPNAPETVNGKQTTLLAQLQSIWQYAYMSPYGLPTGTTKMTSASFDPNIAGILKFFPKANITPSASNGWNNYQYISTVPQNRWEATGKVDYAISDNTKLSVSYTRQIENDQHPIGVWWTPPWTLPYPSGVNAATTSQEFMSNLTHVFSPTTTNEFVFTLARYINPSTLANPKAVDRAALGFNVKGLFGHTTSQIPNIEGPWGGAFPNIEEFSFDGGFQGNAFGAIKRDPALYDNFTKVIGSHTLKAGFYWDTSENIQSSGGLGPGDNGTYNLGWGSNSSGNVVADFLLGRAGNYQQVSSFPTNDLKFHQWSIYAQDSFKANRQLTLNYGLRFDHVGQWFGTPQGFQVWNPGSYQNNQLTYNSSGVTVNPAPNNTGLLWHALNSRVPLSGFNSPLFYYEPRVGLAYDIFGTGKTVLRSGFAVFHYQVSTEVANAATGPEGSFVYTTNNVTNGYAQINSGTTGFTPPSSVAQNGATISALQAGDNKTPLTMNWNVTVSQALPWRSVLEVSYVANKSQNEWINGSNGKLGDLNNIYPGSLFLPDPLKTVCSGGNCQPAITSPSPLPCTSSTSTNAQALDCGRMIQTATTGPVPASTYYGLGFNANDYRPLNAYQDIYLLNHGSYANYNSLQVSWQKQSGPVTFLTNYTFGKVLGIVDGQTDNGPGNGSVVDPFSIRNNYMPLAYDHTHILNFSYVWNMPKFIHGNRVLSGAVNGWQLSGYTTYQSGAALEPNIVNNLNINNAGVSLTFPTNGAPDLPDNTIRLPNGLKSNNINAATWFGSSSYNLLMPTLLCDPSKGLKSGQSFNDQCFGMPAYGQQGPLEWPYMRGPAYFDSDLALFKNFQITERQKLQFRISAVNFLNHPLRQFGLAGTSDQILNFSKKYDFPISTAKSGSAGNECAYLASNGGLDSANPGNASFCNALVNGISPTNTNLSTNGIPKFKTGSRTLTFAVKYFF